MARPTWRLAPLLFGSGMCALVYQVAWFREFRLVFGASTSANAAVLAVFIGGLGIGGLVIGKRADRHPQPVLLYAKLEGAIAVLVALGPGLLWLARKAYIASGGTTAWGGAGATAFRIVITAAVLAGPTFLMGGTLPAAARGVETDDDSARRALGLLYGANTLGAVVGCLFSNFLLLEVFGTRLTLWMTCLVNVLVAVGASAASRTIAERAAAAPPAPPPPADAAPDGAEPPPAWFALAAAATVGFAFFLMELVWYRMLSPLLGGTVFTFGLILAVALLGIGLGGAAYGQIGANRPATLARFARTCLLEAAFLAIPFALGDRLAHLALLLRPLGTVGFGGFVAGWTVLAVIVVLPASFVSGVQFPMLIALLGRGRNRVGIDTGLAYAWNTGGAIVGSLAGGFGLLPALSAPGCWRLVVWLLAGLGLVAVVLHWRTSRSLRSLFAPAGIALATALMMRAEGPTATWRHSPIGVGRVAAEVTSSPIMYRGWDAEQRRAIRWEKDGVESAVALDGRSGWAFVVNGKVDGNARTDAPTQVMAGLLGALLHPGVKTAMIIGLGTGSTAGWLGALPDIDRVDVSELEPAILHVAEMCTPVNHDVLRNPRVKVAIGDAREHLLTTKNRYDLVFSEPSNPYRAGIASLFTREYYEAIADRLAEGGLFLQWLQTYEVDNRTVRTVYATLGSVFSNVETWELQPNDLLLVASRGPIVHDLAAIRARLATEPYRSAIGSAWRAVDAEGFFSHYVARPSFARAIAEAHGEGINTDDQNLVEFSFARSATRGGAAGSAEIRRVARMRRENRPADVEKDLDWERVDDEWMAFQAAEQVDVELPDSASPGQRQRAIAFAHYKAGGSADALAAWRSQPREPHGPTELAMLAEVTADVGDPSALALIERLRPVQPTEADAILARLLVRRGKLAEATDTLVSAFARYRRDPWPLPFVMHQAIATAFEVAARDPASMPTLRAALAIPFAVSMLDDTRATAVLTMARSRAPDAHCAEPLAAFEPYVPWQVDVLSWRARCYQGLGHPTAARAAAELDEYLAEKQAPFGAGLPEPVPGGRP